MKALVRLKIAKTETELSDFQLDSFFRFVQRKDVPLADMVNDVLLRAPHGSPADRAAQILSEFLTESKKTGEPLYFNDLPYHTYLRRQRFLPDSDAAQIR